MRATISTFLRDIRRRLSRFRPGAPVACFQRGSNGTVLEPDVLFAHQQLHQRVRESRRATAGSPEHCCSSSKSEARAPRAALLVPRWLLLQAGCFESGRTLGEPFNAGRLAVAECRDQPETEGGCGPARSTAGVMFHVRNEHVLSHVEDLTQLERLIVPGRGDL